MNANELADELLEDIKWLVTLNTSLPERLTKAATMLRQQQAEIEALKEGIEKLKDAYCQRDSQVRQQQAEIAALKEQLEIVSTNLRQGISKSIQKAQAKAIDETLDDWKRTREYCS